jgi:hypothetical protein
MNPFRIERYDHGPERLRDGTIQIFEDFRDRPDGTKQYVRTTWVAWGYTSHALIRDHWQPHEITREMTASDLRHCARFRREEKHRKDEPYGMGIEWRVPDEETWKRIFEILDRHAKNQG